MRAYNNLLPIDGIYIFFSPSIVFNDNNPLGKGKKLLTNAQEKERRTQRTQRETGEFILALIVFFFLHSSQIQ